MSERFSGKVRVTNTHRPNPGGINTKLVTRITLDGDNGSALLGGNGNDGDLALFKSTGDNKTVNQATIHLDGEGGTVWIGGKGAGGRLLLRDKNRKQTLFFEGEHGNITLGGNNHDGDLLVNDANGRRTVHINGQDGNITLGGNNHDGDLAVKDRKGKTTIHLDGDAGDIILKNADCAEDFDIAGGTDVEPGTVMSIDHEGNLRPSVQACEKNVVGVVSGAGDYQPGIVLDRQSSRESRSPIALMGKVFCNVDASYGEIRPGDLLTTSPTLGHAMKVKDAREACGAIIGKALQPLAQGSGMIPIVIALQ